LFKILFAKRNTKSLVWPNLPFLAKDNLRDWDLHSQDSPSAQGKRRGGERGAVRRPEQSVVHVSRSLSSK
jgi:hypothetical protein